MENDFKDKVVLVTGGAGGIGKAIAKKFGSRGGRIALIDINDEKLHEAVKDITDETGAETTPYVCDISSEDNVKEVFETIIANLKRIDVVVNNAGLMLFKPLEEQTLADWQKIFSVDLFGAFFFIKYAFLNMKPGGAIVNVSSIHARETEPMIAPYAAAKSALLSLTRSASLEGKPKGIRINAVLPGAVDTPMLWDNPNVKSGVEKINPADVGKPEDIADAIVYLCSDSAAFIQGAMLTVDGGRLDRL
ncbi:MAG: SDR family oxidoreductase [Flavobacterium sp.]|nr:MAG: SDR family oxidoreductase [Flavobacterium sp.]